MPAGRRPATVDPQRTTEETMHRPILVAYATEHGSTGEVAEAVGDVLREHGLEVDLRQAGTVDDLAGYGGVVLGGSLYTGRWHRDARRFLRRNGAALADLPLAIFALGPRTTDEADLGDSGAQLERALA